MRRRRVVVLFLTVLLLGFSTALAAELDLMDRQGTIVHALALPIGSAVYLDAVYVDAISQDAFVIREWCNPRRTIAVSMIPPPAISLDQLVDVEGVLGRLADGSPAILNPHVYGYLNEQGNLDPDPFVIKMWDEPIPWPWGLVDMSTVLPDESGASRMPGMESMETLTLIEGTIGWAKQQNDTVTIDLTGKEVTAGTNQFDGCIYIEETDRSSGIRVATTGSFVPGDIVDITGGTMAESNGELYIAGATVEAVDTAEDLLGPIFVINRNLGGEDFGYQLGMLQGFGPNNIGLLVTCCGRVTAIYPEEKCFYIDDGSALDDQEHEGITGIKVTWDGQAAGSTTIVPPALGSTVIVTGISTTEMPGEARIPVLRPRDQQDISEYEDTTPPNPGVATSPPYTSTSPITVEYSGASDDLSGLDHVELWYKKGALGAWTNSGMTSTTASGSFEFDLEDGKGIYYFDLVAEDNAGIWSAAASGDGDCSTIYDTSLAPSGRAFLYTEYLYPGGPVVRTSAHDEEGAEVRHIAYAYGLEGELLARAGSSETVGYTYDSLYRLTSLADGKIQTTQYLYDEVGNLVKVDYPGGDTVKFGDFDTGGNLLESYYDPNGNVTQRVDGNGVVTKYHYDDPQDLLTQIEYPATPSLNVTFKYDTVYGLLERMQDGTEENNYTYRIDYTYDDLDLPQTVTTTYTGLSAKEIGYTYYDNGSLDQIQTPAGNFSYIYDEAGRPIGLTNPSSEEFSWSYLNNNWLHTQTSPVSSTSYSYNPRGFLTDLTNRKTDETLLSQFAGDPGMSYDSLGNLTSMAVTLPAVTAYEGATDYTYDAKDQLAQEHTTRNGGYTNAFAYDAAGNPTTFEGAARSFNSKNQNSTFTYDGNGNPTTYQSGASLTYDPEDRMTAYGTSLTAGYTGEGLRAWKGEGSARDHFLYSGGIPVCEMDSSGNITAVNTFGPTGLLGRHAGSASAFYTFDPQGNVVQTLDSDADVTATTLYDAYGTKLNTGTLAPFGYGGQSGYYTDPETGLLLLTHRYYDPAEGRFLTRDPIGYSGGMNLYGYVGGNPVNMVDPLGLWTFQLGGNPAGGAGGGGTAEAGFVVGYSRKTGWEFGTYKTVGGGGYGGISGSISVTFTVSGNAGIEKVSGPAGQVGGSIGGFGPELLCAGVEANIMLRGGKPTYTGSVGAGTGLTPGELHGNVTNTWVQPLWSSRKHLPPKPQKVKPKL